MNDRFKFRVWDKGNEQYLDPEDMDCVCHLPNGCFTIATWDGIQGDMKYWADEDIVVEMSTGLKDKSGKLIFEGDVVYDSVYENNFVVSWDNDRTGYILSADNTNHIDYLSKILIERHNLKIIGNIHEQAEQKDVK